MGEVVRFSWSLGVSVGAVDDFKVTRSQLQTESTSVGRIMSEALIRRYGLSPKTEQALDERVSNLRLVLKLNGEAGGFDPSSVTIGEDTDASRKEIYFTPAALGEEVVNLCYARSQLIRNVKELSDEGYSSRVDDAHLSVLTDEKIISTAMKLVFARRILKYGVLNNELMPEDLARRLFFESWIMKLSENEQLKGVEYNEESLRDFYAKDNIAMKALRRSVWSELLYSIVQVDEKLYPLFYIAYRNHLSENGAHTVTFSHPHVPYLSTGQVNQGITSLLTPGTGSVLMQAATI